MEIVGNIKDLLTTIVNIIAGNWDLFLLWNWYSSLRWRQLSLRLSWLIIFSVLAISCINNMCFDVVIVTNTIPLLVLPTKIKARPKMIKLFLISTFQKKVQASWKKYIYMIDGRYCDFYLFVWYTSHKKVKYVYSLYS